MASVCVNACVCVYVCAELHRHPRVQWHRYHHSPHPQWHQPSGKEADGPCVRTEGKWRLRARGGGLWEESVYALPGMWHSRCCETKYQRQFCLTAQMTHIARSDLKCRTSLFPEKGLGRGYQFFQSGHLGDAELSPELRNSKSIQEGKAWNLTSSAGWEGEEKHHSSVVSDLAALGGREQLKKSTTKPFRCHQNHFSLCQEAPFSVLPLTRQLIMLS